MGKTKFVVILALTFATGLVLVLFADKVPEEAPIPLTLHWLKLAWIGVHWVSIEILPKVGEAFLIAPVLALVVDQAAKQNLLEEFAKDVSSHIIGRFLPNELREHIHSYLTVDIVRLNLDLVYTLKELADGETVELETEMMSDLHNYSIKDIETEIPVYISESLNPALGATLITEIKAGDAVYRAGDVTNKLEISSTSKVFRLKLKLPASRPGVLPHGTRCVVKSKEFFGTSGETSYVAIYPVLGATITVNHPPGYDVEVDLTYSVDPKRSLTELPPPASKRWKINDPILQGQGLFVRWSKKTISNAPAN